MNWFDIFVVILLLRTGYMGLKNGLSLEIYKAVGLVSSGLAAFYFHQKLALLINQYIITFLSDTQLYVISFLLVLLSGMLVFKLIFMVVQKLIQLNFAKSFDAVSGMILGLGRGVLIACLVFVILQLSGIDHLGQSMREKSFSGPYIVKINNQIDSILVKLLP